MKLLLKKEEQYESLTESYQPRRTNTPVKQHFENLLGKPPNVTHEPITKIICYQLYIKLRKFTHGKLESVLRKIKNRKAAGRDEIITAVWKTRKFNDLLFRHCNDVYNQNTIDRWTKGCTLPFHKNGDLGIAKNYRRKTLTSIATKIYHVPLCHPIGLKIRRYLGRTKMALRDIDPRHHKFLQSVEF